MSRGFLFAPTHPDALLLELAFAIEVLVGYALAWETCEGYAWVVFCGGSDMDAWNCRGLTGVLLQKRTRNELAFDFEFGDYRTVTESSVESSTG